MKVQTTCVAIAVVMLAGIITSSPITTDQESAVVSVLHVSSCMYDEVREILEIAGAIAYFDVTQIGLGDFNEGQPAELSQYDVIAFGVRDCYDLGSDIGRLSELRLYVENGGGIVWTHDTLEWGDYLGPDVEEPAGVAYISPVPLVILDEIQIVLDQQMVHEPFEIGDVDDIFTIHETHTTGGQVTTADVIIKFHGWDGGARNFYLTAHEWFNGRVVVDEIGHSITGCHGEFLGWPDVLESRIFANALWWAGGGALDPGAGLDIDPDTLNLKSRGRWVTAYLTFEDAEPEDVDLSTVLLLGTLSPERWDNQNGTLMLKFNRQDVQSLMSVGESMEIVVSGELKDGRVFEASDFIRVIDPGG